MRLLSRIIFILVAVAVTGMAASTTRADRFYDYLEAMADSLRRQPVLQLKTVECEFVTVAVPADWMAKWRRCVYGGGNSRSYSMCCIGNRRHDRVWAYHVDSYLNDTLSLNNILKLIEIPVAGHPVCYDDSTKEWHCRYTATHYGFRDTATITHEIFVRKHGSVDILYIRHEGHDSITAPIHDSWDNSHRFRESWPDIYHQGPVK